MNADELAGLMELAPTYIQYRVEAATMLRQQQAEIEALKATNREFMLELLKQSPWRTR
jgi:hypothetical protein